jgi:hypothetical protein
LGYTKEPITGLSTDKVLIKLKAEVKRFIKMVFITEPAGYEKLQYLIFKDHGVT